MQRSINKRLFPFFVLFIGVVLFLYFWQAYQLASQFYVSDKPELVTSANPEMAIALAELQFLFAKGNYDRVITQGTPKIGYGDDFKRIIEKASTVQAALEQVSQLIQANQFQAAAKLASQFDEPKLQELTVRAKHQVEVVLAELQYLYAKGDYDGVIQKGNLKVAFSDEIETLVEQTNQQRTLAKRRQIKTELKTRLDDKSSQNITIAVIGDSLADGIWAAIYRKLRKFKQFTIHNESVTSGGLAASDWQPKIEKLLKKHRVHFAIVILGTNDGRVIFQEGKRRIPYKSELWKEAYMQRIHNLMRLLNARNVPTYWVGLPTVRRENLKEQIVMLNRFYEKSAPLFATVRFLPTRPITVNEKGEYSAYLKVEGRQKKVRANDGVHFTVHGYNILSDYILRNIFNDFPFLKILKS